MKARRLRTPQDELFDGVPEDIAALNREARRIARREARRRWSKEFGSTDRRVAGPPPRGSEGAS